MNKLKICVYAICKNEEQFVDRWINSMSEADEIYVLDTGSTDNTISLLKQKGVIVNKKAINPFRFDIARNISLDLIPNLYDVYVCTDLDEVFNNGWRNELEKVWKKNTTKLRYIYNWSLDNNNKPLITFYYEKIHNKKYRWINPVHEILRNNNNIENVITNDNIILNHYPDTTKSRSSYLSLLELSVKENPNNDRNMHYLGREYMYYRKWNKAIDTLIRHLNMKESIWKDERCASMRFISRCYINLKRYNEAIMWLNKAIDEAPYLRDPYIEKALLEYQLKNYKLVKKYCLKALKITSHKKTYINEIFSYDSTIYDLLSISYFYENKFKQSKHYCLNAIKLCPNNKRLKNNLKIIKKRIKDIK